MAGPTGACRKRRPRRSPVARLDAQQGALDEIASPPAFGQHVREWTAGEFYWVLRCFWDDVRLWTLPNLDAHMKRLAAAPGYQPPIERQGLLSRDQVILAVCERPRR